MPKPDYDTSLARMAGNIAAGLVTRGTYDGESQALAMAAVRLARAIVQELKRIESPTTDPAVLERSEYHR